ncbi:MAG TPA: aldo/keto reductase [Longimicrobium sp.]|nr:aldo/keto reductase [Longimicrobium sp.]
MTAESRYERMPYRRCGRSGLKLPSISLGLWHNFGSVDPFENARAMVLRAFDLGVTHFDLANNYGPAPGSAEETFGRILKRDLAGHRDELVISTKAGYRMWPGPYGDGGSRKYLLSSLDQSLGRMGIDYVDVFYHHRPDAETPIEESMGALEQAVRSGKALYAAVSNYNPEQTRQAAAILRESRTPFVLHQPKYSMFERTPEQGLFDVLEAEGIGGIVFSPLAQGLLTDRYLQGIPEDSRAARPSGFLQREQVTEQRIEQVRRLNQIAEGRGQSLAQLALAWVLRQPAVTSALIGASRVEQLEANVATIDRLELTRDELQAIEDILASPGRE